MSGGTRDRILDAGLRRFATRGYDATSLDDLAADLGVRKQSILYWFRSKDAVLDAVVDRTASELAVALEEALVDSGPGWDRVESVVRSVFRLAGRRPEVLGLLREVSRLGPPVSDRAMAALDHLVQRAREFLEAEMDAGHMKRHDPRLVLLAAYSMVIGMATEVDLLRALGMEANRRTLALRRRELLSFLRSALLVEA